METRVHTPDDGEPALVQDVLDSLKKEKLQARLESQNWGDWIHLRNSDTVISIESNHGLTTTATIEHGEEPADPAILRAFDRLGWVGIDEDGEFSLA